MRKDSLELESRKLTDAIINKCVGHAVSCTAFSACLRPAYVGEWLSLVEHLVRDQGVGGSNPLAPTIHLQQHQSLAETASSDLSTI